MTTAALKKKIKALVDQETSEHRLLNALASLSDDTPSNELRARVNEQVARAEADFKAGRFYTGDEAYRKIKAVLKDRKDGKDEKAA